MNPILDTYLLVRLLVAPAERVEEKGDVQCLARVAEEIEDLLQREGGGLKETLQERIRVRLEALGNDGVSGDGFQERPEFRDEEEGLNERVQVARGSRIIDTDGSGVVFAGKLPVHVEEARDETRFEQRRHLLDDHSEEDRAATAHLCSNGNVHSASFVDVGEHVGGGHGDEGKTLALLGTSDNNLEAHLNVLIIYVGKTLG